MNKKCKTNNKTILQFDGIPYHNNIKMLLIGQLYTLMQAENNIFLLQILWSLDNKST